MSEHIVDLFAYCSGTVSQHMGKSLIFPVYIRQKVLGSFWQVQDLLEIDDLRGSLPNGRIQLRQTLQIAQFFFFHVKPSLLIHPFRPPVQQAFRLHNIRQHSL